EAGLRSFDRSMPEEVNRIVTDSLADLLLTPSADANENLKNEGIPDAKIKLVGNIMIDALIANLEKARNSSIMFDLALKRKRFAYVTLHRPCNVDTHQNLARIMEALTALSAQMPVVFPVHPRTAKMLKQFNISYETNHLMRILPP